MPDLLIEIGTEEIPASYIGPAMESIAAHIEDALLNAHLGVGEPTALGTPRRMAFHFPGVSLVGESITEERRGPAAKIAFDAEGNLTRAGLGFARGAGVDPEALFVVETDKGAYVSATVARPGVRAADVVAEALPKALRGATFKKTMRWTGSDIPFARPIRNLVVLHGTELVPVEVAGVKSRRTTHGHAFLATAHVGLKGADLDLYREALREARVLVDAAERRESIRRQVGEIAGAAAADALHEGLLDEVVQLAEWPVVVEGRIEDRFLELPVEVLETAMRVHLRFFPVWAGPETLAPRFLAVIDRAASSADLVRDGLERVLRARLSDARFFLVEDRKIPLADRIEALADKALHRDLGSYRDKAARMGSIARILSADAGLGLDDAVLERAADLAKTDLLTQMVGEFPELQGTVGRIYAADQGETAEVAEAIEDHYRPRGPGDALPRGPLACVLSLAEKVDNLAGFSAAVSLPSGSSDPFGLRRQALGIVRIACDRDIRFSLERVLVAALAAMPGSIPDSREVKGRAAATFVGERFYQLMLDRGFRYDHVRAAMAASFDDLADCATRVAALREMSGAPWWNQLVAVVERTANISKGLEGAPRVDEALFEFEEERALFDADGAASGELERLAAAQEYVALAEKFALVYADPVHRYFERVFVNVPDEALRRSRLSLLATVSRRFGGRVADLREIEKSGETEAG